MTFSLRARQRCADPKILRPHQSVDSDHRSASATASAGRCCVGSAVSPRVRNSLSDPCLHSPNGLSTRWRVLGRIYMGHKSKAMLPTAVNRSGQKQQRKYMNNQKLFFSKDYKASKVQPTHEHSSHKLLMQVLPATWLLVLGCMVGG